MSAKYLIVRELADIEIASIPLPLLQTDCETQTTAMHHCNAHASQ